MVKVVLFPLTSVNVSSINNYSRLDFQNIISCFSFQLNTKKSFFKREAKWENVSAILANGSVCWRIFSVIVLGQYSFIGQCQWGKWASGPINKVSYVSHGSNILIKSMFFASVPVSGFLPWVSSITSLHDRLQAVR